MIHNRKLARTSKSRASFRWRRGNIAGVEPLEARRLLALTAGFSSNAGSPTNAPFDAVEITFSEPVVDFDLSDLSLRRLAGEPSDVQLEVLAEEVAADSNLTVHAISADGTTLVGQAGEGDERRAFRWTAETGVELLAPAPSVARAVSADGSTILGEFPSDEIFLSKAFIWRDGAILDSDEPLGPEFAVSLDGFAAAFSFAPSFTTHIWTEQDGLREINRHPPNQAVPMGRIDISNGGDVLVGPAWNAASVWTRDNVTLAVPGMPSGLRTSSTQTVSPEGGYVFGTRKIEGDDAYDLFRWKVGSSEAPLSLGPRADGSGFAEGDFVAGSATAGRAAVIRTAGDDYVWTEQHGPRNIRQLLTSAGMNVDSWVEIDLWEISAAGTEVVGAARLETGALEYFRVQLGSPSENLLSSQQSLEPIDETRWRLSGLGEVTLAEGRYELAFSPDHDLRSAEGDLLEGHADLFWTLDQTAPSASIELLEVGTTLEDYLDSFEITFDELTEELRATDFVLTRDGGGNLLTAEVFADPDLAPLVSRVDGRTWKLENLAGVISRSGDYRLELRPETTQVADRAGNRLAEAAAVEFERLATVQFAEDLPALRSSAVSSVEIQFSDPVVGLGLEDLLLTQNGERNLLTGRERLSQISETTWLLEDLDALTFAPGNYLLRLTAEDSGIESTSGRELWMGDAYAWTTGHDFIKDERVEYSFTFGAWAWSEPELAFDGDLTTEFYSFRDDFGFSSADAVAEVSVTANFPRPVQLLGWEWTFGANGSGRGTSSVTANTSTTVTTQEGKVLFVIERGRTLSSDRDAARASSSIGSTQVLLAPDGLTEGVTFQVRASGSGLGDGDIAAFARAYISEMTHLLGRLDTGDGDFDGDGITDLADFSVLKQNFGQRDLLGDRGDANGDGIVDLKDFALLKSKL